MKQIFFIGILLFSLGFVFTACSDNKTKENTSKSTDKNEQLARDEMYTCSMHNEVMSANKGTCPKCNMKLTKQKMTTDQEKMMKDGSYTKSKEEQ